jgi:small nuclear ribonucleoprotein (snRNP)-like protein
MLNLTGSLGGTDSYFNLLDLDVKKLGARASRRDASTYQFSRQIISTLLNVAV